ncbi:hypothetical protein MVEN_00083800 [Mycena venus]|uniref:Uncharacterized protein n=1 Tax=Mycena venus TaxID=2733690 RepID=A0A8H6Z452_9AGAR|nr:hypothetical protein MVEN_00083800 [Mycena venus]
MRHSETNEQIFTRLSSYHHHLQCSPLIHSAVQPQHVHMTTYRCRYAVCRRELRRKTAKKEPRAGKDYLCCDDVSHLNEFWRWFPRSPARPSSLSAPAQPSSSSAPPAPPSSSQNTHVTSPCAHDTCIVNKKCRCKQCKRHCVASGGYRCPGHHPPPDAPPQDTTPRLSASFLNALSAAVDIFTPHPSTLITQAATDEQKLRVTHPHWFSSPTPSPARPSSLPITFTLVDFAYDQKPAILRAMHSSNWDWVRPGDRPYDAYSVAFSRWMPVEAAYSHNLRHRQRILIRSRGVTRSDEDVHIATLVAEVQVYENKLPFAAHTPPLPRPLRLPASPSQHRLASSVSLGMVGKGKKRKIEEESSDDEVIVTGYKAPTPSHRPRLTVCISSSSTSLPALSPSSPGPSTPSTAGPSTPTFLPLDSSPTFPPSIPLPPRRTPWKF